VTQITSMDLKRHQTTEQTAYILEQDVQWTYIKMLSFGTIVDVAKKRNIARRSGNQIPYVQLRMKSLH
jgi:hypothetical protein